MDNNKANININETSVTINQKTYSWTNRNEIRSKVIRSLKNNENITIGVVVRKALQIEEKEFELLGEEQILEISKKILKIFNEHRQFKNTLENKINEFKESIEKTKKQGNLEPQENQSENEGEYTTNENILHQLINKKDYDSCARMLIAHSNEETISSKQKKI